MRIMTVGRAAAAAFGLFASVAATGACAQERPWRFLGVTSASSPESAWFISGEPAAGRGVVPAMLARVQAAGAAQRDGQAVGYELWFPDINCDSGRYGLRGVHAFNEQGRIFSMADPDSFEDSEAIPAGSAIEMAMAFRCKGRVPADAARYAKDDLITAGRAKLRARQRIAP